MPSDANAAGDIFGGWVMAQMDLACGIRAAERAKGRVVTAAVKEILRQADEDRRHAVHLHPC